MSRDALTASDVTVVIPYFAAPRRVIGAVRSVLRQRVPVARVLVVSDGDPSVPAERLVRMDEQRVTVHVFDRNRGNYFVREAAWRAAQSECIAFLDADDEVEPEWIGRLLDTAEGNGGVAFCATRLVRSFGPVDRTIKTRSVRPELAGGPEPHHFAIHNALFDRGRIEAAGGFDPAFRIGYDTLFINFVALTGPFGVVHEPLYIRRQKDVFSRQRSLTTSRETGKGSPQRLRVIRQVEDLYRRFAPEFRDDPIVAREHLLRLRDSQLEHEVEVEVERLRTVLADHRAHG